MTTVQITRPNEWTNRIRKYKIYLDNEEIGTINNDSTLTIDIPDGKHVMKAKIDWCCSPEIEIDAQGTIPKYIKVSSGSLTKWMPFLAIPFIFITIFGRDFLHIEPLYIVVPMLILLAYVVTIGRKKYLDLKEF